MNKDEYERQLKAAGDIQRKAGWNESSIMMYAMEHRAITGDNYESLLMVGAGLAQDNSRFGVEK